MKSARELYGAPKAQLAFVIGCGPSIEKAKRYLMEPHDHVIRIALNAAIEDIPAEYWLWIDGDAYLLKGIVHGMDDETALRLLKLIRGAIRDEGCLLILEDVPQGRQETNPQKAFMDLMMLDRKSTRLNSSHSSVSRMPSSA